MITRSDLVDGVAQQPPDHDGTGQRIGFSKWIRYQGAWLQVLRPWPLPGVAVPTVWVCTQAGEYGLFDGVDLLLISEL